LRQKKKFEDPVHKREGGRETQGIVFDHVREKISASEKIAKTGLLSFSFSFSSFSSFPPPPPPPLILQE